MKPLSRFVLMLSLPFTTSCATMFGGTSDEVLFNSTPQGANVYCGEDLLGKTPISADISRSADEVRFEHSDYGSRVIPLDSSFRFGPLLLDLLFTPGFGTSGILIDTLTQAWWDHPAIVVCDFTTRAERTP